MSCLLRITTLGLFGLPGCLGFTAISTANCSRSENGERKSLILYNQGLYLVFFRRSLTRGGCSTFPFPSELTWAGITGLIYELVNCFDAQLIQYSKRFAALAGWGRAADSLLKQISVLAVNLQPVIGSCFPHHSFGDCGALPQTGC